jgi:hypothetical protein
MGHHEDALDLIQTCYELRRRVLGRNHPSTLSTLELVNRLQEEAEAQKKNALSIDLWLSEIRLV